MKRQCGDCTKCCEGYLSGQANGKSFYNGKPCHFLAIGKGCTIYSTRPKEPCQVYKCAWLMDEEIPEWIKPSEVNAIIDYMGIDGIPYIRVTEAGETLRSDVLSWLIQYVVNTGKNICYQVKGGFNWIGSPEFLDAMRKQNNQT